jgi:hypothetical protein
MLWQATIDADIQPVHLLIQLEPAQHQVADITPNPLDALEK